uniref:Uncharacterized protein n=2 Tax=Calcidiscus leptoporus TaxID=127549 RepID=A0A7S0P3J2_9EUKA|mmetsp:Transcript_53588/g.123187  ORF Transcript_53588/g.123187 Transcript_53588/m.123187 type:complete len:277 (+) Transcript_53588:128-958(+)
MHRVPEAMLTDGEPDVAFMLSWANEPWKRTWDGMNTKGGLMLDQTYGSKTEWARHFDYLQQFWNHPKHIAIGGRPLFAIYRIGHIPVSDLREMLSFWKQRAISRGVKPPLVVQTLNNFYYVDNVAMKLQAYGVDNNDGLIGGSLHFWPTIPFFEKNKSRAWGMMSSTSDLDITPAAPQWWGAYLSFDRRVRVPGATTYQHTPSEVRTSLVASFRKMGHFKRPFPNLMFLTAFNEWNEQAVLEPDDTYGAAMLHALQSALSAVPVRTVLDPACFSKG